MKKTLILISCILLAIGMLVGCGCEHQFTDKVTKQATCAEEGEKIMTCSLCEKKKTVVIEKTTEHKYSEKVTKMATCAEEGEMVQTCSVCQKSETIILEKTNDHKYTDKVTKKATCAEEGEKVQTCSVCQKSETVPVKKTDKHKYTEKITKKATCAVAGSKTKTCSVCEKTVTEEIAKTNSHSTGLGKCTICGQNVTTLKPKLNTIDNKVSVGINYLNKCLDYTGAALTSPRYSGAGTAVTNFFYARSMGFKEALNACGNYPEFSTIKSALQVIVNKIDTALPASVSLYGDSRDLQTLKAITNALNATTSQVKTIQAELNRLKSY